MDIQGSEAEQALCQYLIELELLNRDQINDAFLYQCRLPKSEAMSIEQILVEMELISASALEWVKRSQRQAPRRVNPVPASGRPSLQPLKTPGAGHAVCKTAELSLSPELRAVIGQTAPTASLTPAGPVRPLSLDEIPFDELNQPAPVSRRRNTQPLPQLEQVDLSRPVKPLSLDEIPFDELNQPVQPTRRSTRPLPEIAAPPMGLSLRQTMMTSAPLRPRAAQPLGQILLQNHDVEEWQLMHALCLQKEATTASPRLGTLLVRLGYANHQSVERALSLQLAAELRAERQAS